MLGMMQNKGKTPPRSVFKNDPIYRSPFMKRIPGPLQKKNYHTLNLTFILAFLKQEQLLIRKQEKNNCYLYTIVRK